MNLSNKIKPITDGAIICAIYAVVFLLSRFIGDLLESYLYIVVPIPITIYGFKHGLKNSLITMVACLAITFLTLWNPISPLFYVLPGLIVGVFYPFIIKSEKCNTIIEILYASLVSLIVNLLTSVIFASFLGVDLVTQMSETVDEMAVIFSAAGLSESFLEILRALMISLIPSTIIIMAVMEGIILNVATNFILVRLKYIPRIKLKNFNMEDIPTFVGVGYIGMFILMMVALNRLTTFEGAMYIFASIILNIGIVYSFFMIYQGIYLTSVYAKARNSKFLIVIAILSIFMIPYVMLIVGILQNIMHLSKKLIQSKPTDTNL